MQRWYSWLHGKKKVEETRREEEHEKLVDRMISSAEGGAGFLHQNHESDGSEMRFYI